MAAAILAGDVTEWEGKRLEQYVNIAGSGGIQVGDDVLVTYNHEELPDKMRVVGFFPCIADDGPRLDGTQLAPEQRNYLVGSRGESVCKAKKRCESACVLMVAAERAAVADDVWLYGPIARTFIDTQCHDNNFLHITKQKMAVQTASPAPTPRKRRQDPVPDSPAAPVRKRRVVTCKLSSSDAATQCMVNDLYNNIAPQFWNESRRKQNPDGPFDASSKPIQGQENVHGVARLIGTGGYSMQKLHVSALFTGGMKRHCEQLLVAELEEGLDRCKDMALTPKHMFELRVVIEHEFVCQSCYEALVRFCKENGVAELNVYRPTRLSRNGGEDKLVAGSSCMRGARGDDFDVQLTAHWPCTVGHGERRFKPLRAPSKPGLFFACGCGKAVV